MIPCLNCYNQDYSQRVLHVQWYLYGCCGWGTGIFKIKFSGTNPFAVTVARLATTITGASLTAVMICIMAVSSRKWFGIHMQTVKSYREPFCLHNTTHSNTHKCALHLRHQKILTRLLFYILNFCFWQPICKNCKKFPTILCVYDHSL